MEIPNQLKDASFVILGGDDGKKPIQKGWQKKIIKKENPIFVKHLSDGKNYGVRCGEASPVIIDNESYFLIGVDFDDEETQKKLLKFLPKTFTVKTGGKGLFHLYFASNDTKSFKIFDEKMNTFADVQGEGKQLVGPGSINPKTKRAYEVVKDIPISFIEYSELKALLMSYDKSPKKVEKAKKQYTPKDIDGDLIQQILGSVSLMEVLEEIGIDTTKNPTNCFEHDSIGGKCLGFNSETAHCFHCDKSWNKYSLIRDAKNLSDKRTFEWFAEKAGKLDELNQSRKEFIEKQKEETGVNESGDMFSRRGQVEQFWDRQPFFYDESKLFWLWDKKNFKWCLSDETDFCNLIWETLGVDTISYKNRGELVEGFKQVGRKHKPKDIEKSWIQFKDVIYDVKSGLEFKASPQYFVTNPIPWKVGESEDTPTIDRLFNEWVGEDYIQTLYEITAYNTTTDKFMQRIIALCGGGSNGKGTFAKFNYKFLGEENTVSSEIKSLSENPFEPAVLHKKLLCVMGEVSHDDLRNTNMLKKLGGEDKISFQFKGKTPFTGDNSATCMCLTNSLPITPDRSLGFYRKWLIIDFPNQFHQIKENPINSIPDVEFENLALKVLRILKGLYENPSFHNEGDFDERVKRYEERSNPIMKFVEDCCDEESDRTIKLREFTIRLNDYLKEKHLRILTANQVSKVLREEGFEVGNRRINDVSARVILNLVFKSPERKEQEDIINNTKLSKLSKLSY